MEEKGSEKTFEVYEVFIKSSMSPSLPFTLMLFPVSSPSLVPFLQESAAPLEVDTFEKQLVLNSLDPEYHLDISIS